MKKLLGIVSALALCTLMGTAAEAGTKVNETENLSGSKNVTWYLPTGTPQAWVYLQHGYSRSRSNMDHLATSLMDAGLMVLTVDDSVTYGNVTEARSVADAIFDAPPTPPSGYSLPSKMIASGYSAGGMFASALAGRLAERNYAPLVGVLFFDPVPKKGDENIFAGELAKIKARNLPILTIIALPGSCNENNNAKPKLQALEDSFVGIQLTDGSTHNDFEGDSGGGGFSGMCGSPKDLNIDYIMEIAPVWAADIASGTKNASYYPGGTRLSQIISANDAAFIKAWSGPVCGNSIVEDGEECDGGGCCDSGCEIVTSGVICRAAADSCDIAETCDGVNGTCADDDGLANGTSCGSGKECWDGACITPPNCGNSIIEQGEECDGEACCASDCTLEDAGTLCRSDAGSCDVAELCDGAAATCPADSLEPDGTACDSGKVCQAGSCVSQPTGWVTVLNNSNLSAAANALTYYQFSVPNGATDVEIKITGGTGDADMHTKKDVQVSASVYDCRPYAGGNEEVCTHQGGGTYYILLKAYSAYSGITLTGKYFFPGAQCGNGIIEDGEECDGGSCCDSSCSFSGTSTVCRPSAGPCDVAESCSGSAATCPADGFSHSSTVCRSSADQCDAVEYCTGAAAACPVDGDLPNGTSCSGGTCEGGTCTSATVCGNNIVESGEDCDGGACCTSSCTFKGVGTSCRSASGECDAAEVCTGSSELCPADANLPDGTTCSVGVCSSGSCIEQSSGWVTEVNQTSLGGTANSLQYFSFSVPASGSDVEVAMSGGTGDADLHVKKNAAVTTSVYDCRPYTGGNNETCQDSGEGTYNILVKGYSTFAGVSLVGKWYSSGPVCGNGIVEGSEVCDGGACCSTSCTFKSSSTVCRAAADSCDVAENCSGSASTCPADIFQPNGTSCSGGTCSAGSCVANPVCGNSVVESGEQCDGGACCSTSCTFKSSGTVCRADAGECDVAEVCTGTVSTCPADSFEPSGTTCSGGECDAAGSCESSGGGGW